MIVTFLFFKSQSSTAQTALMHERQRNSEPTSLHSHMLPEYISENYTYVNL